MTSIQRALTLAALCGSKIALGPALLGKKQGWKSGQTWANVALGEMTLDKLGVFPARYRPALLIPHTAAGAWVAHEVAKEEGNTDPTQAAIIGAAVAAGVAIALPIARITLKKVLGIPDVVLGLAEDYAALRIGSEATGLSMEQITDVGRQSLGELKHRVEPAIEQAKAKVGLAS